MTPLLCRMNKLAAYTVIGVLWTLLLAFGVGCALALPLNLVLVPCWLACAGSVGRLAEELLDKRPKAVPEATTSRARVRELVLTTTSS